MKELIKQIEYMRNVANAITTGVDKFVRSVPIYTKQQLKAETRKRLNTTADHYMAHSKVKLTDYILVVQLDKEDWLTQALESGVGAFDMKKMLNSGRARTSKEGFRYMSIPMGKSKDATPGTEKGQEFQKKINEVLSAPKFGMRKLNTLMNGTVVESQQILTNDPMIKGLYRTRAFESAEVYHSGRKKPAWQHVMFRTMSENPMSRSQWEHPGIKPANILRAVNTWLDLNLEPLLNSFVEAEIKAVTDSTKIGG